MAIKPHKASALISLLQHLLTPLRRNRKFRLFSLIFFLLLLTIKCKNKTESVMFTTIPAHSQSCMLISQVCQNFQNIISLYALYAIECNRLEGHGLSTLDHCTASRPSLLCSHLHKNTEAMQTFQAFRFFDPTGKSFKNSASGLRKFK